MLEQAVIAFAVLAALITMVPGLDTALVLRAALTGSRRDAVWSVAGVSVGVLLWGMSAAAGVAALLTVSRVAYDVVRLLGAAYLVLLGVRLLVGAVRRSGPAQRHAPQQGGVTAFRRGLLTNLLNPKVGVFYVATLPQFPVEGLPPLATGALLAGVHVLIGVVWFAGIAGAARAASRWLRRPAVARSIDGVTGAVLIAFGVRTAVESV